MNVGALFDGDFDDNTAFAAGVVVDYGIVDRLGIGDDDFGVIVRAQSGVEQVNRGNPALFARYLDVVVFFERLVEDNHYAACDVAEAVLERKTYGDAAGSYHRNDGRRVDSHSRKRGYEDNYFQDNVHECRDEIDHSLVALGTLEQNRLENLFDDPAYNQPDNEYDCSEEYSPARVFEKINDFLSEIFHCALRDVYRRCLAAQHYDYTTLTSSDKEKSTFRKIYVARPNERDVLPPKARAEAHVETYSYDCARAVKMI